MPDENLVLDENSLLDAGASTFTVESLTERLIREYENVHTSDLKTRDQAVNVAAVLARYFDGAYDLVAQHVMDYARIRCDVCDASPYSPNGIDVIKKTNRKEAPRFLEDLRHKFVGYAQSQATEALLGFNATVTSECARLDSGDWKDSKTWKSCMSENEKRCLAAYFAATLGGKPA